MSVALYMDVHVPEAITRGLRSRGVDVITAQEDDQEETPDVELLRRAAELRRFLVTQDEDFLSMGAAWEAKGIYFSGIGFGRQNRLTVRRAIEDLSLIGLAGELADVENRIHFLPLA